MDDLIEEGKILLAITAGTTLIYTIFRLGLGSVKQNVLQLFQYPITLFCRKREDEYIPIGTVKNLYIYPAKSCKAKEVFSFWCGPKGPELGELKDRYLVVIHSDGRYVSAQEFPRLEWVEADVANGEVIVRTPDGGSASRKVTEIRKDYIVKRASLKFNLHTDGVDCGDEISKVLSTYIGEPGIRMLYYIDGLYTERDLQTHKDWWMNNKVPNRLDKIAFANLCPYLIQTEGSVDDLNKRLEGDPVSQLYFRPVIVVDRCPPWDEDKWADVKIGDTILQCYKPCTRCPMVAVDPVTGKKHPNLLKTLKSFRLPPEGVMRNEMKDNPMFGVNAGITKAGYIHQGQTVYVRYKPGGAL